MGDVKPGQLAQVLHSNGATYYVLDAALDAGAPFLNTFSRAGKLKTARGHTVPVSRDALALASEMTLLADGPAEQTLTPGVAPIALQARQLEHEIQRRDARRHNSPLPSGGLFDETAKAQGSLF